MEDVLFGGSLFYLQVLLQLAAQLLMLTGAVLAARWLPTWIGNGLVIGSGSWLLGSTLSIWLPFAWLIDEFVTPIPASAVRVAAIAGQFANYVGLVLFGIAFFQAGRYLARLVASQSD
ncbi:MAG: hypothetical protein F6J97_24365 [Leptolyngbya sp. SIO4C1]|nr:hypothetical protein [Leptolyngbya sp. SIO4C1]